MDFNFDFEKIKRGVKKTAQKAKEVSGNVVETAKYKLKLSEIKSNIEDKYIEIGKLVYNSGENEDITSKLETLCDEISALKASENDIKEAVDEIMNKKSCPFCSASVDKDFTFCPKCGKSFDE